MIELFLRAGYDGVIITDHFSDYNPIFTRPGSWLEKTDRFWEGYEDFREAAAREGLAVFPGLELTFRGDPNDYLIYGLSRQWIREHSSFHHWTLESFAANVDRREVLIVQAHPFRFGMIPRTSPVVDGIEVYNGNARHDSGNPSALEWARTRELLQTSGSDFHKPEDCGRGGMVFPRRIDGIEDFIVQVREGSASLVWEGESTLACC